MIAGLMRMLRVGAAIGIGRVPVRCMRIHMWIGVQIGVEAGVRRPGLGGAGRRACAPATRHETHPATRDESLEENHPQERSDDAAHATHPRTWLAAPAPAGLSFTFVHVSRSVTVRLKTRCPGAESIGSLMK